MLSDEQRRTLLKIARDSIAGVLDGRAPELTAEQFDEVLRQPSGVFVTLRTGEGELRGCIGSIRAVEPLYKAVASSAISAAFRDPRFLPVNRNELPNLALEISVMSPLERVQSVDEIEIGRDGLVISRGRYAGLLLPQVATEYQWDRDTFLDQTCVKAGLPRGSWRGEDTRIERFSAEVFCEQTARQ